MNQQQIETLRKFIEPLQAYHKHEVQGIENIPQTGPCLLVVNHSLATYDILLLLKTIFDNNGRIARSLMDRWFFVVPTIAAFMEKIGAVQGSPEMAVKLLKQGELVCVAPGGMMESLRPSTNRYQICWEKRRGFVRLAMQAGAPIVLAACPKADDIYDVFPSKLTSWFYENFKIPLPMLRGLGPTPLPRPVELTHFLSKPIVPPKPLADPAAFKRQVNRFHAQVVKKMELLIGEAVAYRRP